MSRSRGTGSGPGCLPRFWVAGLFIFLAIMIGLLTFRVFWADTSDPFADDSTPTGTVVVPDPSSSDGGADGEDAGRSAAEAGETPVGAAASCGADLELAVSEVGTSYDVGAPTMQVTFLSGSADAAELTVSGPDALMERVEVRISADPAASDAKLVVLERLVEEPLDTGVYTLTFLASSGDEECEQPFDLEIVRYSGTQ